MLQDIIDKADKWGNDGKSGRIDPFTEVYEVSRPRDVCQFVLLGLIPRTFSVSFRHDRPNGYMLRPGKKWSRSQEDPGAVSDPPDQRYSCFLALALVPEPCEEESEAGHHRIFRDALHLH